MTRLWQGDVEGARKVLLDILDDTAIADAKLAGWHSLWIGAAYEGDGDLETPSLITRKRGPACRTGSTSPREPWAAHRRMPVTANAPRRCARLT